MKKYCYDCGQCAWEEFGDGLLHCGTCDELVFPHERIGLWAAIWRRLQFPWISKSQGRHGVC